MSKVRITIRKNGCKYDDLLLNEEQVVKRKISSGGCPSKACGDVKPVGTLRIRCDGLLTYYIVREVKISRNYRNSLIENVCKSGSNAVVIELAEVNTEIIDYAWGNRLNYMAWERLELDHALSWLSTLGGAFSALGDYFENAAKMAGRISLRQFTLAMRLNDPNIEARCRLFMALSLIQQGRLRRARGIVRNEYWRARSERVVDERLVKMCLGIWAKLKYEWGRRRQRRRKINGLCTLNM